MHKMEQKAAPSASSSVPVARHPLGGYLEPVKQRRLLPVRWTDSLRQYRAKLRKRIVLRFVLGTAVYLVAYNAVVGWYMGPNHPVNNFTFRWWMRNGMLDPELVEKNNRLKHVIRTQYYMDPYAKK